MKIPLEVIGKLAGREIVQLIYNKFSLVIIFENGEINIESKYEFIDTSQNSELNQFPLTKQDNLISIIGNKIKAADLDNNNNLQIIFSNGSKLRISKDNDNDFEAYSLSIDGELYVTN